MPASIIADVTVTDEGAGVMRMIAVEGVAPS